MWWHKLCSHHATKLCIFVYYSLDRRGYAVQQVHRDNMSLNQSRWRIQPSYVWFILTSQNYSAQWLIFALTSLVSVASSLYSTDQTEVDCSPGTENSEQHNLLEQLQSRYRQMEERITCPICIDNHIKLVFQCGHASCIDCSAALKTCPICRQTIRERIQLFVWEILSP